MAKAKKKSPTKPKGKRADNYDEKLAINGSFADVIKVSVDYTPPKKNKKEKKK